MKKQFALSIVLLTVLLPCTARSKYINFGTALSSGFNLHSDGDLAKQNPLFSDSSAARILIGANVDATFCTSDTLQIVAGSDLFCDFHIKDKLYYHTFDYSFFTGIKIFPNLQGLNFSIAYVLGNRTDFKQFYDEDEQLIRGYKNTKWGNGFRLSVEYDFLYDSDSKIIPFAGFYYRHIPRGNNHNDNILSAYIGIRF